MEPPSNSHWSTAASSQPSVSEQQRLSGSFGPSHPIQQIPLGAVPLPPPNQGIMYRSPNANSLPPLGGLPQSSPQQASHSLSQQRQTPPGPHHQQLPPQSGAYTLPALGQSMSQDRQYHEAEIRELEERQRQQEKDIMEQQRVEQRSPPSVHAGSIPLQQPTASRISQALHAPNGLLGANPVAGLPSSLGAPSGPVNVFASNGHTHEPNRGYLIPVPTLPQHLAAMNQPPHSGMTQGQQPILNDALTYLDQVKVRFADQPEVYNKFLDIMKEFKGQVIDTPGVINRVSTLFNGHPQLIQGFNTFLPPGYKIEAGWGDDPNSIRVTTPQGSKIQNTGLRNVLHGFGSRGNRWMLGDPSVSPSRAYAATPHRIMDGVYDESSNARQVETHPQRQGQAIWLREEDVNPTDAMLMHQQEQTGVTQLQDAIHITEAQSHAFRSNMDTQASAPGGNHGLSLTTLPALPGEKRPAVEFNHAINYVNKIKTRFNQQPEIYKEFLEILQTYQREFKPIGEVYAQVTRLFEGASDLLEDFKQFLPEPAAHARQQQQQAARAIEELPMSNERGDANYIRNIPSMTTTPKTEKMPPIGHFGPASVTKDNKKRRAGPNSSAAPTSIIAESSKTNNIVLAVNPAKRQKINIAKSTPVELPIPPPSLVPELPRPMPPAVKAIDAGSTLDRIKKFLGNKAVWLEFLRIIEGFTSGIISKDDMVAKIDDAFIGQNLELSNTFKKLVEYDGQDTIIENIPAPSENKVVLSNCRGYGPSYRMLPTRERASKCSGRDAMCYDVLNDEWASHPTWASEDSGFVSHKKNQYEETLHRMEEERHDYDFNIESASRMVLLLEPLVQQVKSLSPEEQRTYAVPFALGGQSEAIWQRVVKKLYERVPGQKMIDDLRAKPSKAGPIILYRLKDKVEKWKQSQREWEKIWREQTSKVFWKSLDHQAINAKAENKKYFQPKQLQTEIGVKYEEQRRQRQLKSSTTVSRYQFDYTLTDTEIILDTCHMMLTYLRTSWPNNDASKIESFIKNVIPAFFGLDQEAFTLRMADVYNDTPPNEEDDDSAANDETPSHRARRANGKQNLLRGVLDPSKSGKKDSRMTSKESTPDIMSMDEETATPTDSQSDIAKSSLLESRWIELVRGRSALKLDVPFDRTSHSLYANLNIYCFMRLFAMFYERLHKIKLYEDEVQEDVRRALIAKAAAELVMSDRSPLDFFEDVSPTANFYKQIVKMCESCMEGHIEMIKVEETLRRFYIPCGYQLYNFDKWLSALLKFAGQSTINDAKDRSNDIINLFLANRADISTTHQAEIDYRKQVEKFVKDGDIYRIVYHSESQRVTMQVFKRDDQTFDPEGRSNDFNWSYYAVSFGTFGWTEGVPHCIRWPFLRRNVTKDAEIEEDAKEYLPLLGHETLTFDISPVNYRLLYNPNTSDWWLHSKNMRATGMTGLSLISEERTSQFEAKFVKNEKWMAGLSQDEVKSMRAVFGELDNAATATNQLAEDHRTGDEDVEMDGA